MEDFRTLNVSFSIADGSAASTHTIYCKLHVVRQDSKVTPNKRTLFTLGWPPYCNKEEIECIFSRAGNVTAVHLQEHPGPVDQGQMLDRYKFRVGYIVFPSEGDALAAVQLCESPDSIQCPLSSSSLIGLRKWSCDYALGRPSVDKLEEEADVGVAIYDRRQEEVAKAKKRAGEPDEEGWITVTRKTPKLELNNSSMGRRHKKKKQQPVGINAYPWQQRESQREEIAQLRKKFEEDKQRVAVMKAKRKFKPF